MKLALLLSALAALGLWGSVELDAMSGSASSIALPRTPVRASVTNLTSPPRNDAISIDASAPPLFREAATPAALAATQAGENFTLIGLAGAGDTRTALLRDSADQHVYTVRAGDTLRDWRVLETSDRCVTLSREHRTQNVCLS